MIIAYEIFKFNFLDNIIDNNKLMDCSSVKQWVVIMKG